MNRRAILAKRQEARVVAGEPDASTLRSPCPVACALDIIGDRWTLLVVRDLLGGKRRYGDLLRSAESIPTNILAERLKRLERAGLVRRVQYSEHPPRAEYELTAAGQGLGETIAVLGRWGREQFPNRPRRAD
jgi:DNA-binding HxlR family transcriptional regulator